MRNIDLELAIVRDGRRRYVLSAAAQMSPNQLGGIISGRVEATAAQRQRLAETLGVDEHSIFAVKVV